MMLKYGGTRFYGPNSEGMSMGPLPAPSPPSPPSPPSLPSPPSPPSPPLPPNPSAPSALLAVEDKAADGAPATPVTFTVCHSFSGPAEVVEAAPVPLGKELK